MLFQPAYNLCDTIYWIMSPDEFERVYEQFLTPEKTPKPLLFEVWTNSDEESEALRILRNMKSDPTGKTKHLVKQYLGPKGINFVKNILKK